MLRHTAPLTSLAVFEVAARHEHFVRAAEELHLTPGAVAHHVRQVEAWLGVPLFERKARGVSLNASGRRYAAYLSKMLDTLERETERIRRLGDERVVTVSATPSFVTRWIMPRLGHWSEACPSVDVRVLASIHCVDFGTEGVDVAIRLGAGHYADLMAELLLEETFIAVCSPAYRERFSDVRVPADLVRCTLLHDEFESRIPMEIDWLRWLRHFGVTVAGMTGPRFSHTYLTLEAAAAGQGVAIAASVLVEQDLASGRLVQLLPQEMSGPYRYYMVRPDLQVQPPPVEQFCQWLRERAHEARQERSRQS